MAKIILSKKLTKKNDKRYVIVDNISNEIIDDAQGFGYKSLKTAKTALQRAESKEEKKIRKWMKKNKTFVEKMDRYAAEISKGLWGPKVKFNTTFVNELIIDSCLHPNFSAKELYEVWKKNKTL